MIIYKRKRKPQARQVFLVVISKQLQQKNNRTESARGEEQRKLKPKNPILFKDQKDFKDKTKKNALKIVLLTYSPIKSPLWLCILKTRIPNTKAVVPQ